MCTVTTLRRWVGVWIEWLVPAEYFLKLAAFTSDGGATSTIMKSTEAIDSQMLQSIDSPELVGVFLENSSMKANTNRVAKQRNAVLTAES